MVRWIYPNQGGSTMVVCFFEHKDAPASIKTALEREVEYLISVGADCFLVGNQGGFDAMVLGCLRKFVIKYPAISYRVVLAYMPKPGDSEFRPGETMLPEGMESIHPKYAIAYRNKWMAEESDAAVVYVAHSWGGAAKYAGMMETKGKTVINLYRAGVTDPAEPVG